MQYKQDTTLLEERYSSRKINGLDVIEGTVVVKVLIGKKGLVEKAEIFKSIPILDEAALKAAKKCIFKPAKQRDKLVKVWMSIPFKFKLQ